MSNKCKINHCTVDEHKGWTRCALITKHFLDTTRDEVDQFLTRTSLLSYPVSTFNINSKFPEKYSREKGNIATFV